MAVAAIEVNICQLCDPLVVALLEEKILAGKQATGRPGMDLWQILVLGVVRLGLNANYDRLEDLANHHLLLRQILGVNETPWGGTGGGVQL